MVTDFGMVETPFGLRRPHAEKEEGNFKTKTPKAKNQENVGIELMACHR